RAGVIGVGGLRILDEVVDASVLNVPTEVARVAIRNGAAESFSARYVARDDVVAAHLVLRLLGIVAVAADLVIGVEGAAVVIEAILRERAGRKSQDRNRRHCDRKDAHAYQLLHRVHAVTSPNVPTIY